MLPPGVKNKYAVKWDELKIFLLSCTTHEAKDIAQETHNAAREVTLRLAQLNESMNTFKV